MLARFGDAMAEDFLYKRINTPNVIEEEAQSQARNDLLLFIEIRLMQANKSMSDFNFPIPSHENEDLEFYRAGEVDPEARTFFEENIDKLNVDQDQIWATLKPLIDREEGGLFMIDAPGGTGKTFLCNVISAHVRKNNNVNINTALSGVAATFLKLGTNSHRRFRFPIPCFEDSSCTIKLDSEKAKIIAEAKIIFVDECSMMS